MTEEVRAVGLFAGVGGIELGLQRGLGASTAALCENWGPAQTVLRSRFPDVGVEEDVRQFRSVPSGTTILAAGFPCTDLSQAGRTAGIRGENSGLVVHVFEALRRVRVKKNRPWLLIENVQNMLALDQGRAMDYLVNELEALGYRWAYRVVDSRFTGVPQRRRRVILLASVHEEPGMVLFADEAGEPGSARYRADAFGFYSTEGLRGLGWAQDAVPTLKGGSTIGIPSPPAIWVPDAEPGRKLVWPRIEDAEALQGFPRGWTAAASDGKRDGARWKLLGNAVTVGVAEWVASRIAQPGDEEAAREPLTGHPWPSAAAGEAGKRWRVAVSEYPILKPYQHLLDVVDAHKATPLTHRAAAGFLDRLERGNLGRYPGFRADVAEHVELTRGAQRQAIA
jgi:DNA (cytosine-5)-methyltransferase 1